MEASEAHGRPRTGGVQIDCVKWRHALFNRLAVLVRMNLRLRNLCDIRCAHGMLMPPNHGEVVIP